MQMRGDLDGYLSNVDMWYHGAELVGLEKEWIQLTLHRRSNRAL